MTYIGLETGEKIDEERMAGGIGHLEDSLLGQKRLDLVAGDDVALFQRFNGEVLASVAILRQNDLFGEQVAKDLVPCLFVLLAFVSRLSKKEKTNKDMSILCRNGRARGR